VGSPASTKADAELYAAFLLQMRTALASRGVRVTAAVAQWSPMLRQYATLSAAADRLMDMETYTANSMQGWLQGDAYGGYYEPFVSDCQPRASAAPAIGGWAQMCGTGPCWTSSNASGAQRIDRMIADGILEAAVFRLVQRPPQVVMPQDWWWPLLERFARAPLQLSAAR